jgi:DNA-binding beta-propeller fold protein YncE
VTKGLLFVALTQPEGSYDGIKIYDVREKDPKPLAYITDGADVPVSACIDQDQTLYVLNESERGWITEYTLGRTAASKIITKGANDPAFCAIDARGNLWITNIGSANVTEYLHGAAKPYRVISNGLSYPVGIAIDHAGNMYVANRGGGSDTNVQVYLPGHSSPSQTITEGVKWPIGIAVDSTGTLYVTNATPGNIAEYRPSSTKPYRTITQGLNGPGAITFAPNGWMFVTNLGEQSGGSGPPDVVLEFAPNSQSPSKKMIANGIHAPLGTAYYPPALP